MTPDDPDARLADFLAAYDDARADGTAPPDWHTLDPDSRARLDEDRSVLDQLDRLWASGGRKPPVSASPTGDGTGGLRPPLAPDAFPFDFGRFRARRKLGAGGCGVVFLADDPVLGRPVALKVPRPDVLANPDLSRRFLREARTAAVLTHPNIVPVYEAGGAGGVYYIAAEFCPGPTLGGWLAGHPPPTPRAAAALVAALADAMGYAHRRGVVHRDLKPSNVLLYARGPTVAAPPADADLADVVPKVTDFGFAKLLERDDDGTRAGTVIGTPPYMAPEQAEGRLAAVGPATDVYALGCILYELLAGRPPIRGATDADTLRQLLSVEPPRPRAARPDCPPDLEAVCLRCLEKDPTKRYPDGAALADDLGRFLAGEPTTARPLGWVERAEKWARRHPVGAALAGVVIAAALGMAALGVMYNRDLADRNAALEAALTREQEQAAVARRQAYLAQVRYLGGLARAGRRNELAAALDQDVGDDLRGFEWHYLARLARSTRVARGFPGAVDGVSLSADGTRAAAVAGGEARVWEVATGRVVRAVPTAASDLVLSADGRRLALSEPSRDTGPAAVRVVTVETGAEVRIGPAGDRGRLSTELGFSRGGHRLLTVTGDHVTVYDADTAAAVRTAGTRGRSVWMTALAPGGDVAAITWIVPTGLQTVLHDVATGAEVPLPRGVERYVDLAFSADGRYLATVAWGANFVRQVTVWDVAARVRLDGAVLWDVNNCRVVGLADGRIAAVGWTDGEESAKVRLGVWSPADRRWAERTVEPGCQVRCATVSADGRRLLVGAIDRTARVVELDPPAGDRGWPAHAPAEAWAVAFAPDGTTLVTGGDDSGGGVHPVRVWDARTGVPVGATAGHGSLVTSVAFAPDGGSFASGSFDGTVTVWDAADRTARRSLAHGDKVRSVAYSPDGALVAAGGGGGAVTVWEAATGRRVHTLPGHSGHVPAVVFVGPRTIVSSDLDALRWWDAADGRLVRTVADAIKIGRLALSPDGRVLVVVTGSGQVVFRDAADGAERGRGYGPPVRLSTAAVSPDGRTVATGGLDGAVRLWRADTGEELFPVCEAGPQVNGVAFSPDGSTLAAVRHDGQLLLWETRDP